MICSKCNNEVQNNLQYCPICGNPLSFDSNVYGVQPMATMVQAVQNDVVQDKVNIGLAILSWFIPIAGLIVFIAMKQKSPKTAKVSGICALISFILNMFIVIGSFALFFGAFKSSYDNNVNKPGIVENDNSTKDEVVESEQNDVATELSNDWKMYQFSVNGKILTLPTTYEKLSTATGFTFKDSNLTGTLKNGYYSPVNMYKDGSYALAVEVLNDSGVESKYIDSKITRVTQTKNQVSRVGIKLVFPGGISAGDSITEDQIINLYGQPNKIEDYNAENYISKTYVYVEDTSWTTTNNFKIKIVNGVIDEIQLDNRR